MDLCYFLQPALGSATRRGNNETQLSALDIPVMYQYHCTSSNNSEHTEVLYRNSRGKSSTGMQKGQVLIHSSVLHKNIAAVQVLLQNIVVVLQDGHRRRGRTDLPYSTLYSSKKQSAI